MEKGIPANEKILEIKKNFADVYSIYQKKLSVKAKLVVRKTAEKKGVPLVLQSKSTKKNRDRDCSCYGFNDCVVYFSTVFIKEGFEHENHSYRGLAFGKAFGRNLPARGSGIFPASVFPFFRTGKTGSDSFSGGYL